MRIQRKSDAGIQRLVESKKRPASSEWRLNVGPECETRSKIKPAQDQRASGPNFWPDIQVCTAVLSVSMFIVLATNLPSYLLHLTFYVFCHYDYAALSSFANCIFQSATAFMQLGFAWRPWGPPACIQKVDTRGQFRSTKTASKTFIDFSWLPFDPRAIRIELPFFLVLFL